MSSAPQPPSICVFCGSASGNDPAYAALARALGTRLAQRNIRLVYGGGGIGLMGETARACLAAGGDVIGIMPRFLSEREVMVDTAPLELVDNLHQRKARMAELSHGFITLPGGIGTLEEAVEILSWVRLDQIKKPMAFLDDGRFYDGFFEFLEISEQAGFIQHWKKDQGQRTSDVDTAIDYALGPLPI